MSRAALVSNSSLTVSREDLVYWMHARMKAGELKHAVFDNAKEQFTSVSQIDMVAAYYVALNRFQKGDLDDTMPIPTALLKLVVEASRAAGPQ